MKIVAEKEPKNPEYLKTPHGIFEICPTCGKHLSEKYNETTGIYEYVDVCTVCGQKILRDIVNSD